MKKNCQYCGSEYQKKQNVSVKSWEQSKFCSRSCMQKGKDSSHLKKYYIKPGEVIGKSTQFSSDRTTGKNNVQWKGDTATYTAKHMWIKYHYGAPKGCDFCGTSEDRMYHWANISNEYLRDRNDWFRLCVPCHRSFDRQKKEL